MGYIPMQHLESLAKGQTYAEWLRAGIFTQQGTHGQGGGVQDTVADKPVALQKVAAINAVPYSARQGCEVQDTAADKLWLWQRGGSAVSRL